LSGEAQLLINTLQSQTISTDPTATNSIEVARLNRLLLDDSFPNETMPIYRIGPEEMLSMNPVLVMILLPFMTLAVYPLAGRLATPLRRMSCGMFLAGASYLLLRRFNHGSMPVKRSASGGRPLPYIVITIAEILVSTTWPGVCLS
jgi:dipeptide/tripeptide permease